MKTRAVIQKEIREKRYRAIFDDVQKGIDFEQIAKDYGYVSKESARVSYYQTVLPHIKRQFEEKNEDLY